MRILWMQIALCTAIILEAAIFGKDSLARIFELTFNNIFQRGEVWQLFTSTLVHANPFQLLFNALTLWMFGSELEQRWGRSVFFRFYLACALGATLAFLGLAAVFPMMRNDIFTTSTGVNLGLLIAYAIYWPDRQIWFFFLFPLRMKFVALITGAIAIMYAISSAPFALAAAGHVGGLIAAGLILLLSGGEPARLDRPFQRLAEMFRRVEVRSTGKSAPRAENSENLEVKIDAILDKISRGGMKSLTNEEKKFLRDASDRMNRTKH
ncbi:MAG: rhomboid family intramembrane serine protease [Turneriella sp.]|nr:rhomboid family intramembrane serine protease [Turneriella sp.]